MTTWPTVELQQVAEIERDTVTADRISSGDRYVGLENIEAGGATVDFDVVEAGELASNKFRFSDANILYGKLRPYLAKIVAPDFDGICSTDILPIRPGPDVDKRYLLHHLRRPESVAYANGRTSGANLPRISPSELGRLPVPLPPLEEQRRIADVLDRADALRAKRRAAIVLLDTLPQAIFHQMFGDPAVNSHSWPEFEFDTVAPSRLGKKLYKTRQTGQYPRPYLRNQNVQWFDTDISDVYSMDFFPDEQVMYRLEPGDLVICEGGQPGRTALWRGEVPECYFQMAVHRARPDAERATSEYLMFMLHSLVSRNLLDRHMSTSTIAHLTSERLKVLSVPVPPIDLQRQFTRVVDSVRRIAAAHRAALAELDELFASLQQRAFRGEL